MKQIPVKEMVPEKWTATPAVSRAVAKASRPFHFYVPAVSSWQNMRQFSYGLWLVLASTSDMTWHSRRSKATVCGFTGSPILAYYPKTMSCAVVSSRSL